MIDLTNISRALILAPHTDDAELGCGGTISRMRRAGVQVKVLVFSAAEESVPKEFAPDSNRQDCLEALACVGVQPDDAEILNFQVREFPAHRQELLEHLIRIRSDYNPQLIIGPSSNDRHQDHEVVHNEMVRAFGHLTLLGFDLAWNCFHFNANCHIELTEQDLADKAEALSKYRSQTGRSYMKPELVTAQAVFRGTQNKLQFAEAFELLHVRLETAPI